MKNLFAIILSLSVCVYGQYDTIGPYDEASISYTSVGGYCVGDTLSFQATYSGKLVQLAVNARSSNGQNVRLAIYSQSGGTKLSEGAGEVTLPTTAAYVGHGTGMSNALSPENIDITQGNYYYVVASFDGTEANTEIGYWTGTTSGYISGQDYTSGFPTSIGKLNDLGIMATLRMIIDTSSGESCTKATGSLSNFDDTIGMPRWFDLGITESFDSVTFSALDSAYWKPSTDSLLIYPIQYYSSQAFKVKIYSCDGDSIDSISITVTTKIDSVKCDSLTLGGTRVENGDPVYWDSGYVLNGYWRRWSETDSLKGGDTTIVLMDSTDTTMNFNMPHFPNGTLIVFEVCDTFSCSESPDTVVVYDAPPQRYTVAYLGNGNTGGTAPDTVDTTDGASVTLSGPGDLTRTNYTFTGWNTAADGSGTSHDTVAVITVVSDTTMYAEWSANYYHIVVKEVDGTGTYGYYPADSGHVGDTIKIWRVSSDGYVFEGWSDDTVSSNGDTCRSKLSGTTDTVTATYRAWPQYTGSGTVSGNGSITWTPEDSTVDSGSVLTAEAVPDAHNHFVGWSGGITSVVNPLNITMLTDTSLTATFGVDSFGLAYTITGGNAAVTFLNDSIAVYGEPIICTLTVLPGYSADWPGGHVGPGKSVLTVVMTQDSTLAITTHAWPEYTIDTVYDAHAPITTQHASLTFDSAGTPPLCTLYVDAATGYVVTWPGGTNVLKDTLIISVTEDSTVTAGSTIIPVIDSIRDSTAVRDLVYPQTGRPSDTMIAFGIGFGSLGDSSQINLNSTGSVKGTILSFSDVKIVFTIPSSAPRGWYSSWVRTNDMIAGTPKYRALQIKRPGGL